MNGPPPVPFLHITTKSGIACQPAGFGALRCSIRMPLGSKATSPPRMAELRLISREIVPGTATTYARLRGYLSLLRIPKQYLLAPRKSDSGS